MSTHSSPLQNDRVLGTGDDCRQRVGAFTELSTLIRQFQVDPLPLLASVGLADDALARADDSVSYIGLCRLLYESARATHCPHFGLLAGRLWHVTDLGLPGELMRDSATVGSALRAFVTRQHLNGPGGLAFLLERGDVVDLGYAICHPGLTGTGTREVYDCTVAVFFNILRELCGPGWFPSEVFIPHTRPTDATSYRNLLKAQPRFDSELCAVRFPARWMERPIETADPKRLQLVQALVARSAPQDLVKQVYRAVRLLLLHGKHAGDHVSKMLSMHRRALNRALHARGTTFQHILDDVRYDVACQLLSDTHIVLDDIAATLGYTGVTSFMRAFNRWTGTSPGHWRRATVNAQRVDAHRCITRPGRIGTTHSAFATV
jgi:AraC-like DNA-binding protein